MLIRDVEKFMREHDMPATKFGRLAAHDPRFVLDLRMGRIPRAETQARTIKWMEEFEAGNRAMARPHSFRITANAEPIFETKGFCYAA